MFLLKLVTSLDEGKLDYALVGGFAVALHGAVRGTIDVDIVISLREDDFILAEKIFSQLGLVGKLPVTARQVFQFRDEYIKNRNLIAWSFYNPTNPLETVDVIITHDKRKMKTKEIAYGKSKLRIASVDDLIKMKSGTGRPQDTADIDALRKLR